VQVGRSLSATQQQAALIASSTALVARRQPKQVASLLDLEGLDCATALQWAPNLAHRVTRQRVVAHRHGEHLGEHAASDSGGAATAFQTSQRLIDHTCLGLGQPEAS
jgi:hypothetical protein